MGCLTPLANDVVENVRFVVLLVVTILPFMETCFTDSEHFRELLEVNTLFGEIAHHFQ